MDEMNIDVNERRLMWKNYVEKLTGSLNRVE